MKPAIVEQLDGAVKVVVRGPRLEKVSSDSVETVGMVGYQFQDYSRWRISQGTKGLARYLCILGRKLGARN